MMDRESELYKGHARKYEGREHLMEEIIPILNCKWNDVVQFSALNPQVIVDKLKTIQDDFKLFTGEHLSLHGVNGGGNSGVLSKGDEASGKHFRLGVDFISSLESR